MLLEGPILWLLRPFMLCNGRSNDVTSISATHMSDAEIANTYDTADAVDAIYRPDLKMFVGRNVHRTANDTVVKCGMIDPGELEAAEFVRQATYIPVPSHQRYILKNGAWNSPLLVMQYIPGRTLYRIWVDLSWWMKFRIALTLRYYVYQLRGLPSRFNLTKPGPFVPGEDIGCQGRLFPETFPPEQFDSYDSLCNWYNDCLFLERKLHPTPNDHEIPPFDGSRPLAVVHQDLHLANLMLGDDGQLWVLDWGMAGVYPDWFEYGNMVKFCVGRSDAPMSWQRLIPWIFGTYEEPGQMPFIRSIAWALFYCPNDFPSLIARLRARETSRTDIDNQNQEVTRDA